MKKASKWDSDSDEEGRDEGAASKKARVGGSSPASKQALPRSQLQQPAPPQSQVPTKEPEPTERPPPEPQPQPPRHHPLFHGCRSIEEYERLNFIDQGTYGFVFKARDKKTREVFAIKQVKLVTSDVGKVGFPITALRETNILLALRHPNIVSVKEMVIGSSNDKVFMVMEYGDNDLKHCMSLATQPFSTAEVKRLLLQLLSAVEHMHNKWYIHRDLKTSNLLYSNAGKLCVCDFGLARTYGSPIAPFTAEVVTLWYRCPELLLGSRLYSTPLDMWSVGCIFGEMLSGKPLLPGEGEADQLSRIFRLLGAPSEDRWPGVSQLPNFSRISASRAPSRGKLRELFPSASFSGGVFLGDQGFDLLSQLLELDPARRISATAALQHPWFAEAPLPCSMALMPKFSSKGD